MPNNENNNDNNIELPSYNKNFINNSNNSTNINNDHHTSTPNLDLPNESVKTEKVGDELEEAARPKQVAQTPQRPIIEIPKEYYEQKEREKEQKEKEAMEQEALKEEMAKNKKSNGHLILLIIFNAIVIFGLIYSYLNYNEKLIFAIPIYIVVMGVFQAIRKKNESLQPLAIMIGGMGVAVITFLVSAIDSKQVDLWSYYAVASAISAFAGLIISKVLTMIIGDRQNIKALQSVGMILVVIALIGVPYFLYQKNPEKVYQIVFQKKSEVKAETEDEYIIKILKNRYDRDFVCDLETIESNVDQKNRKINTRLCYESEVLKTKNIPESDIHNRLQDLEANRIIVTSIAYKQGDNKYIVQDNYMDVAMLSEFEENISNSLTQLLNANKVLVYLYPQENCSFIGNCADNNDYYKNYEKEINPDNQYNSSVNLDFSKYLTMDVDKFVNEYKFKYIITVTSGSFSTEDTYQPAVDKVLSQLDKLGLKNTYGYVINLYNVPPDNPFPTKVHTVEGATNNNQTFSVS